MPGMDGFAFMEEARTRESIRNIPIVVATTENDYQTEKRCLELGVWDFIPKVFQPEIIRFRVLNTIKRSMAHSLEHDGLTGLYTIQKFSQCVKRNLENNQDTKFTFIRLDIERFKMINNFLRSRSRRPSSGLYFRSDRNIFGRTWKTAYSEGLMGCFWHLFSKRREKTQWIYSIYKTGTEKV